MVWKTQIILFVVVAAAFQALVLQLNPFFLSVILLPVYFLLVRGLTRRYVSRPVSTGRMLLEIFVLSLLVRIIEVFAFVFILNQFNDMPFISEHDDFNYHDSMYQMYTYWQEHGVTTVQWTKIRFASGVYSGYPYFGAFMMEIFGPNIYAARIGNAIASSVTVLFVFGILANCADRTRTIFGTLLFAFAPIVTMFAACNFKDTMLLMCILASIWSMSNFINRRRWLPSVVILLLAIGFMIFCRPASIFILLAGSFVYLFFQARSQKRTLIIAFTNVLALVLTLAAWQHFDQLGLTDDYERFFELNRNASQRTIAENTKAGVARLSLAKVLGAPLFAAASPFLPPTVLATYEGKEVTINYTFHGMLAYISLLPMMLAGVFTAFRNRRFLPIPFFLVVVCFLYKFAQASSLLTVFSPRQSLPAIAIFIILVPFGIDRISPRSKFNFIVNLGAILVILAYNVYRFYF